MNKHGLLRWLGVGVLFLLAACQAAPVQPVATSGPEYMVSDMTLTKGAAEAAPLWAYCSPSPENTHIRTFHCRAPVWQTLAVGNLFLLVDKGLLNQGEEELVWEFAIDDHVVNLEPFGTFDYVMPVMPASPSSVREVFAKVTDWDLVLTDLNLGEHILSFRAQNEAESYMWLVHLVIEGTDGADISAAPFPKNWRVLQGDRERVVAR